MDRIIKKLRVQVILIVIILMATVAALGTATYAWFVVNATDNVKTVEFTATGGTALEIAIDVVQQGTTITPTQNQGLLTYKGTITTQDLINSPFYIPTQTTVEGNVVYKGSTLSPVSSADGNIFFEGLDYDTDSRLTSLFTQVSSIETVEGKLTQKYLELPLWFATAKNMDIYLSDISDFYSQEYNQLTHEFEPSNFIRTIRIALVPWKTDGENYVADYQNAVIFEPDGTDDDGNVIGRGDTTTTYLDGGVVKNMHDKDAITDIYEDGSIKSVASQNLTSLSDLLVPANGKTALLPADATGYTKVFSITGGTPQKVTLYIWMDGVDYDCVESISTGPLTANLGFIGAFEQ